MSPLLCKLAPLQLFQIYHKWLLLDLPKLSISFFSIFLLLNQYFLSIGSHCRCLLYQRNHHHLVSALSSLITSESCSCVIKLDAVGNISSNWVNAADPQSLISLSNFRIFQIDFLTTVVLESFAKWHKHIGNISLHIHENYVINIGNLAFNTFHFRRIAFHCCIVG